MSGLTKADLEFRLKGAEDLLDEIGRALTCLPRDILDSIGYLRLARDNSKEHVEELRKQLHEAYESETQILESQNTLLERLNASEQRELSYEITVDTILQRIQAGAL